MHVKPPALVLALALALPAPVVAQDLGTIIGDVAQGLLSQEMDRQAVNEARRTGTAAGWRAYLSRFPNGLFRAEAEREIARLDPRQVQPSPHPRPTPDPVNPVRPDWGNSAINEEAALRLSRDARREIQTQLTRLGHDAGVADGLWGSRTRQAISAWQRQNGHAVTGYVTTAQIRQIAQQAGPVSPVPPSANPVPGDDRAQESLLGLTTSERVEIQRRLTALGYSTRGADGVFGANTRNAIAGWQRARGERITGYITADQLRDLRSATGG